MALREWEALRRAPGGGWSSTAGAEPGNRRKNRYSNVLPYDHNRVRLGDAPALDSVGTYINASRLSSALGEEPPWSHIAAQVNEHDQPY